MITTATFILACSYEACHNDDYDAAPWAALLLLVVFMWFDYSMAEVIL